MSPVDSESDPNPFSPGDVFAGRYRMINRLGQRRHGRGLARRRPRAAHPVALKLIRATSRAGRASASSTRCASRGRLPIRRSAACSTSARRRAGSSTRWSWCRAKTWRRCCAAPAGCRGEGRRHRPSALRRPGGRPRAGRPAPRSQAGQRADRRRRLGPDHRLRLRDRAQTDTGHRRPARPTTWRPSSARPACRCRSRPTSTRWA